MGKEHTFDVGSSGAFLKQSFGSEGQDGLDVFAPFIVIHTLNHKVIEDELLLPCLNHLLFSSVLHPVLQGSSSVIASS